LKVVFLEMTKTGNKVTSGRPTLWRFVRFGPRRRLV